MNIALIKAWISERDPNGKVQLAGAAKVSVGTIDKILRDGHTPGVDIAKEIARVIGVSLDELCSDSPRTKAS